MKGAVTMEQSSKKSEIRKAYEETHRVEHRPATKPKAQEQEGDRRLRVGEDIVCALPKGGELERVSRFSEPIKGENA